MTQVVYLTPAEARLLETYEKRYRKAARLRMEERTAFFSIKSQEETIPPSPSVTRKPAGEAVPPAGLLSFNYRLIFAPPAILDYVVVHELCHLTHMNHSRDFWNMVESVLPDYKERRQWLKEHGQELNLLTFLEKKGIDYRLSST